MVIIVVAIILAVAGLAYYFPLAWGKFQEMIGWGSFDNDFTKAVECSYYRCFVGCQSGEITKLKFNTPYGDSTPCKYFCNSAWTDDGTDKGKICGWNAEQFPVEVSLPGVNDISKDSLKDVADCVLPTEGYTFGQLNAAILAGEWKWVLIDTNPDVIAEIEREECGFGESGIVKNSIKSASTTANNIYAYSKYDSVPGVWEVPWVNQRITWVDGTARYITLKLDPPSPTTLESQERKYRVVLQSQKDPKDMLEYYIKVEGIYVTPSDKYVAVKIGGEGSIEDGRELSVLDSPDFYYQIEEIVRPDRIDYNYLHVKLKDVTIDYIAVLEVEFTTFIPGESSVG